MCFAPQRRAIFHLSSGQLAPHPPLQWAYFSTIRSPKSLEKHSVSRLSYLFAHLYLLSSYSFSSLLSSNLSLLSASSLLCFSSVHIVGSLTSKLPSINHHISIIYIYIYRCVCVCVRLFLVPQPSFDNVAPMARRSPLGPDIQQTSGATAGATTPWRHRKASPGWWRRMTDARWVKPLAPAKFDIFLVWNIVNHHKSRAFLGEFGKSVPPTMCIKEYTDYPSRSKACRACKRLSKIRYEKGPK